MPRRPTQFTIERVNAPDLDAAADAMLPLFLSLLDGRSAKRPPAAPARAQDEREDRTDTG